MVGDDAQGVAKSPPGSLVDFVVRHAQVRTNMCTQQRFETGYRLAPRTVPDYNLIFVTRGQVVWVIEGEPYPLRDGDLVVVPPGVPHHGYSQTPRITLESFHVEASLPSGQDVLAILIPPRFQHVEPNSYLDRYLRTAQAEFDRPDHAQASLMLQSWGRLILLELLRDNALRGRLRYQPIDPLVMDLLEGLRHKLGQPVSLEDLARWSGFSPQHLNRLFQKHIGVTPLQYLTRLRMEQAAQRLLSGQATVRAIAQEVGYDDPYYFSRLFRRHFGRSPAQYRQAAGQPSDPPPA